MKKLLITLALTASASLALAGCSAPSEPVAVGPDTVVIDVRTPGEYAQGHLVDALNIDVQSADFEAQVSQLPTDGTYLVYCKSGNRAGNAISQMTALGFGDTTNIGGLNDAAASTGLEIVTP